MAELSLSCAGWLIDVALQVVCALSCVPIHVSGVAGHEVGIQVLSVCSC